MKKIFLLFAATFMAAGVASAQDINKAIELANQGQEAFQVGEAQLAIDAFSQSLAIAEGLGEEGAELANTCKTAICTIHLSNAKKLIKASDFDGALTKLNETISTAEGYGIADVAADAKDLIPNVYMAKGNGALKAKDMATAIEAYTKVTELNPTNGDAYLRLGRALVASDKITEGITAFENAAANGKEADAKKQISNIFLKKAQACAKAKDNKGTIENALKANEYLESASAYKLAASAAQKMGNNAQCIEFYEKYLEVNPNAKDTNGVIFTIAVLYQKDGNNAKAIEYYQKVVSDPQYGANAQTQLKAIQK